MFEELLDGVYDITCLDEARDRYRAFLFDWETPTLVDTTFEQVQDALFAGIDATGVTPERLVITHADRDHVGAFDAVVERYGVETWVPKESQQRVDVTPDHWFEDGERIGRFEAIHMPGHKSDNYALYDERDRVLVTGDAVHGADRRGLPPGYFLLPQAPYSESLNQAEESLQKLLDLEFDAALVFHGTSVLDRPHEKLRRFVETGLPSERDW